MEVANFQQILTKISDSFDATFQFTARGYLRADRESLNRVAQWWNNYRIIVTLVTGVDTMVVEFRH